MAQTLPTSQRVITFVALTLLALSTSFCLHANAIRESDRVWVIIRPVQCLGNPWEKDWIKRHPRQNVKPLQEKEFEIMKEYFARKKLPVMEIRRKPYEGQGVCDACDCPRGDVLYVMTDVQFVPVFVHMGYTERMPVESNIKRKQ